MDHLQDINHYNTEMKKSLLDKAFFLDKIEGHTFVDFGCADGMLIKFMKELFPNNTYVGYDNNEIEIELAKENLNNVFLTSKWDEVIEYINKFQGKKTIILNSIIHEIYSYCNKDEIEEFWNRVFSFDNVVIRDMFLSKTALRKSDDISAINVRHKANQKHLNDFENVWGSIDYNPNLIHFLTKYRYEANWNREVNENYFPVMFESMISTIPKNFHITYIDHYILPFIRKTIYDDFHVNITDNTHLKLILTKNH
jgi:ribosomal protein L11 methylase PrmA